MDKSGLTIERNALASLILTLGLVVVIVWMNAMGVVRMSNNSDSITRCNNILESVRKLEAHLVDLESGERGYIVTGNVDYLKPHDSALKELYVYRDELGKLLFNDPSEQNELSELNTHLDAKVALSRANVRARSYGFEKARIRVAGGGGMKEMDVLRELLGGMTKKHLARRVELLNERATVMDDMKNNIIIAAVASVIVLLALHWNLLRGLRRLHIAEQKALHWETHDSLTRLPNRRLMLEHIHQGVRRSARNNRIMSVMFLDLNGFKPVNDQYGHKAGDEVLKEAANRLSGVMRGSDRVARFGGDEFVVLVEDIAEVEDICVIVRKMDEAIRQPFQIRDGKTAQISCSIGIAIYPRDGEDSESLLRIADTAMYASKSLQSNCFCMEYGKLSCCTSRREGEVK